MLITGLVALLRLLPILRTCTSQEGSPKKKQCSSHLPVEGIRPLQVCGNEVEQSTWQLNGSKWSRNGTKNEWLHHWRWQRVLEPETESKEWKRTTKNMQRGRREDEERANICRVFDFPPTKSLVRTSSSHSWADGKSSRDSEAIINIQPRAWNRLQSNIVSLVPIQDPFEGPASSLTNRLH